MNHIKNVNVRPSSGWKPSVVESPRSSIADLFPRSPIIDIGMGGQFATHSNSFYKRKKRQIWSKEEDALLEALVKKDPLRKPSWKQLAEELNQQLGTSRAGKQCRERWRNRLRPNIKKGDWTVEEETMIRRMYQAYGPQWAWMAQHLKNRADNDIKNKWYSMERSLRTSTAKQLAALQWPITQEVAPGDKHDLPILPPSESISLVPPGHSPLPAIRSPEPCCSFKSPSSSTLAGLSPWADLTF